MVLAPEVWAWGTSNQEAWSFNGLPLQSAYGAWNITTLGGPRFALPVFRGQNYTAPYRAGQGQRAKMPDSRTITLAMWADGMGEHSTGTYPSTDPRLAFNNNLQQLRAKLFAMGASGSAQGQLERNWYLTQGGVSQLITATAMAELAGSMDLTMNGRTNSAFSVDFLLSDPFFYGAAQSVACTGASTTVTGLGEGVAGIGYPSVVSSFTVQISAACTVTNSTAGVSFTFTPNGSPSYPVTVDILNQTAQDSAANNWGSALSHSGARAWMVVLPGANTIAVSAGTATFHFNDVYV